MNFGCSSLAYSARRSDTLSEEQSIPEVAPLCYVIVMAHRDQRPLARGWGARRNEIFEIRARNSVGNEFLSGIGVGLHNTEARLQHLY